MADNEDMIVPEADEQPVAPPAEPTPQQPVETPTPPPAEVEGALLDNDEPAPANDETTETPAPAETEAGGEAGGDKGDAGDETPSAGTTEERPAETKPAAPEPVADPGAEFTPKNDYSFDIELYDKDGQPYSVHITKPEDIETLPKDADFGTPANLMKAQAKLNTMTTGMDNDRRQWEADKQKFDAQQEANADLEKRVQTITAEVNYLEAKGKLPKIDPKYENADWNDPEVAKQPGIKERLELLTYRAKENEQRAKLGLSPMSVLEAQVFMAQEQAESKAAEVKSRQAQQRKAAGAMVGGTTPTATVSMPDDMIVGEGGNIRDLNPAY